MIRDELIIEEINALWLPVYGFMAAHLLSVSQIPAGRFLDFGPFAGGLALEMLNRSAGISVWVIDESESVLRWAEQRAEQAGNRARLTTQRGSLDTIPVGDGLFDLVAVRGAFFFILPKLLSDVRRVLRPGGFGWVGGGYGPLTPDEVIAPIAERSKALNEALGKKRITEKEAASLVDGAGLQDCSRISTAGGLWIEIRA